MVSDLFLEQNFEFIKIPVPPGLTIYGKLKIGADTVRTTVKLNDHEGITWTMEWPALDMSKGLVRIRKNKEETVRPRIVFYLFIV